MQKILIWKKRVMGRNVGGIEEKVSEQDVEKGLYDKYLIIKE